MRLLRLLGVAGCVTVLAASSLEPRQAPEGKGKGAKQVDAKDDDQKTPPRLDENLITGTVGLAAGFFAGRFSKETGATDKPKRWQRLKNFFSRRVASVAAPYDTLLEKTTYGYLEPDDPDGLCIEDCIRQEVESTSGSFYIFGLGNIYDRCRSPQYCDAPDDEKFRPFFDFWLMHLAEIRRTVGDEERPGPDANAFELRDIPQGVKDAWATGERDRARAKVKPPPMSRFVKPGLRPH